MPILLPNRVKRLEERDFRELDYRVMGLAFSVHNDLGRHLDEEIYESELAYRLNAAGIAAFAQFPITLQFNSYSTTYKADLLVAESTLYEIKAVAALGSAHRAQALCYVLMTETSHGKLVNFGGGKVEGEYVSTQLTIDRRRGFVVDAERWIDTNSSSKRLKELVCELVGDWGLFLATPIYRNAIVDLFGGATFVRQRIDLCLENRCLGSQEMDLIDPDTILVCSSLTEHQQHAERHYRRMLELTGRSFLQWVNFAKHRVEFVTLTSPA
jgi:GxxExxY protein